MHLLVVLPGVQRVEVGYAVHAEHHRLAIDHEPLLTDLALPRRSTGSASSVIAAARYQPDAVTIPLNAEAVPIILDLVKPVGAVWNDLGPGGQAELKHAPKIGIGNGFAKAIPISVDQNDLTPCR